MTVVSFSMAYRSFRGGSGRLHTRPDTPPLINRRHPDSCLARATIAEDQTRTVYGAPPRPHPHRHNRQRRILIFVARKANWSKQVLTLVFRQSRPVGVAAFRTAGSGRRVETESADLQPQLSALE